MGKIPKRWLEYQSMGNAIEGTRFIAFKVPLSEGVCQQLPTSQRFTIDHLMSNIQERDLRLGLVIDLTNTDKYYSKENIEGRGIAYRKIFVQGQGTLPRLSVQKEFCDAVDKFLQLNSDNQDVIGVHCTHGLNRTGYLVCRYMIDRMKFEPKKAIEAVDKARGHNMKRPNYVGDLLRNSRAPINWQLHRGQGNESGGQGASARKQDQGGAQTLLGLQFSPVGSQPFSRKEIVFQPMHAASGLGPQRYPPSKAFHLDPSQDPSFPDSFPALDQDQKVHERLECAQDFAELAHNPTTMATASRDAMPKKNRLSSGWAQRASVKPTVSGAAVDSAKASGAGFNSANWRSGMRDTTRSSGHGTVDHEQLDQRKSSNAQANRSRDDLVQVEKGDAYKPKTGKTLAQVASQFNGSRAENDPQTKTTASSLSTAMCLDRRASDNSRHHRAKVGDSTVVQESTSLEAAEAVIQVTSSLKESRSEGGEHGQGSDTDSNGKKGQLRGAFGHTADNQSEGEPWQNPSKKSGRRRNRGKRRSPPSRNNEK